MSPATIARYEALGWEFNHEEYKNHNNGDWEDDYTVKSPRLDNSFSVHTRYNDKLNREESPWEWMSERALFEAEKLAYVRQRLDGYNNQSNIDKAMEKALLKNPDARRITVTVKLV